MLNFLINSPTYKHLGCVAALALGLGSCEQQKPLPVSVTPIPAAQGEPNRYYLNAQVSTKEVIEQLDPKTITRLDVLKDQKAADYTHDAGTRLVILAQTR